MKRASMIVAGLTAGLVAFSASPAAAWDCIRFVDQKTYERAVDGVDRSGNWALVSLEEFAAGGVADGFVTQEQADCIVEHWIEDGNSEYFAIGIGVAGAKGAEKSGHMSEQDFFALAMNMADHNRANGQGIDHLEALLGTYMGHCGAEAPPHEH